MLIFRDDDAGYFIWKESHVGGYIVNSTRVPRADYLVLHTTFCSSLPPKPAERHFTKDYIKVCADSIDELEAWAQREVGADAQLRECPHCRPR